MLDRDLPIQPLEELEQLVGGEAAEMPVHQVRDFRLLDAEQGGDFPLLELPGRKQLMDVESQLCPSIKLVGILKPQIGEDVAGAFLILDFSLSCYHSCSASSFASLYRCLIKSTSGFGVAMPFFDFF